MLPVIGHADLKDQIVREQRDELTAAYRQYKAAAISGLTSEMATEPTGLTQVVSEADEIARRAVLSDVETYITNTFADVEVLVCKGNDSEWQEGPFFLMGYRESPEGEEGSYMVVDDEGRVSQWTYAIPRWRCDDRKIND